MPRGRPRKQPAPDVSQDTLVLGVAEVLFNWTCGTRGCQPRHHVEEARELITKLRSLGYKIIEGES